MFKASEGTAHNKQLHTVCQDRASHTGPKILEEKSNWLAVALAQGPTQTELSIFSAFDMEKIKLMWSGRRQSKLQVLTLL